MARVERDRDQGRKLEVARRHREALLQMGQADRRVVEAIEGTVVNGFSGSLDRVVRLPTPIPSEGGFYTFVYRLPVTGTDHVEFFLTPDKYIIGGASYPTTEFQNKTNPLIAQVVARDIDHSTRRIQTLQDPLLG